MDEKLKIVRFCLDLSMKCYICSVKKNQERLERKMKQTVKTLKQIKQHLILKQLPSQIGRYLLFHSS